MMKFLKNLLLIVVIFQSPFVLAKKRGAQATPATKPTTQSAQTPKPTPITPPVMQQQPMMPPQSYAQALNAIKTQMTADQVLINNTFNPQFINFVKSLNLSATETQALLQAGMNIHATWTDNNENNRNILSSLRNNIQTITQTQPVPQAQPIQPPRQVQPPQQPIPQPKPIEPPRQLRPPVEQPGQRRQNQPRQQPYFAKASKGKQPQSSRQNKPIPPTMPRQQAQPIQPFVQPPAFKPMEPVQDMGPAENRFFMNDLVMLLDPRKKETVEAGAGSMVQRALIALYQQVSPIIMTTNIWEIIIRIKEIIGEQQLQKLRATRHPQQLLDYAQQLSSQIPMLGSTGVYLVILLSRIDLDIQHINCYFHSADNLVLLIPKRYIQTNMPSAINLSPIDQAKLCGFNPAVLNTATDMSTSHLLQQIQMQKAKPVSEGTFIPHLTSMFTIQKKNNELIHPEQTSKWLIYLSGHGGPAYVVPGDTAGRSRNQLMLIAQIAGISGSQFTQLMKFFDKSIDTAYVHYETCFAGGSNQTFVNETLSVLDIDFLVSTQGIHEGETSSGIGAQYTQTSLEIVGQNYIEFFKLLRMFFTQQKAFVAMKEKAQDPILKIIKTLTSYPTPQNQPFIRFPSAGSFVATSQTEEVTLPNRPREKFLQKTEVLTKTMVKAHEIEQKPINIKTPVNVLVINTSRINVPLNLGKKGPLGNIAIVIPSPEKSLPGYEAITYFKEINWQDTVQSLLFNCSYLNARQHPQTFVINTLSGVLLQQSGLPAPIGSSNIRHFIMNIRSILGKNMTNAPLPSVVLNKLLSAEQVKIGKIGSNINICFEFNDTIYQGMFAIGDTEKTKDLAHNIEQLRFIATPKNSINMNTVASNFLSQQEIARIAKPITLESIAQFIDSKIDKQDPSMAIWSGAEIEDLRKFATDRANK